MRLLHHVHLPHPRLDKKTAHGSFPVSVPTKPALEIAKDKLSEAFQKRQIDVIVNWLCRFEDSPLYLPPANHTHPHPPIPEAITAASGALFSLIQDRRVPREAVEAARAVISQGYTDSASVYSRGPLYTPPQKLLEAFDNRLNTGTFGKLLRLGRTLHK